jgi:hypothetical protein
MNRPPITTVRLGFVAQSIPAQSGKLKAYPSLLYALHPSDSGLVYRNFSVQLQNTLPLTLKGSHVYSPGLQPRVERDAALTCRAQVVYEIFRQFGT